MEPSITFLGTAYLATDADSPAERGSDQEVSCPTSQPTDSEAHRHGLRESFSGHPLESDTGPDPHPLERIERALAPTSQHGPLAIDSGQNAPRNDAKDSTGTTPGPHGGFTLSLEDKTPPLKTLMNPSSACYMNAAVTGLVWGASQVNGLSEDQWSNLGVQPDS